MIWIIIGLLSFVLQIYILKNTWVDEGKGLESFRWEYAQKISIHLWSVILIFLLCMMPILNILEFIIFWIVWLKYYANADSMYNWKNYTYWRLKDKFLSREI